MICSIYYATWGGVGGSAHLHEPDGLIFSSIPSPCEVREFLINLYHYSVLPKNKKRGSTARALAASDG